MTTSSNPPVEMWAVKDLIPYEKNAKKHPPEQIASLARSIDELGWTSLIVVDRDGVIIAGHGRRLAAIELKRTHVPVIVRRDLDKAAADALRLADNKNVSNDYDQALIQEAVAALNLDGFDVSVIGFSDRELEAMTADMAVVSTDFLVEDVGLAVEEQKAENVAKVEATEKGDAPVAEAFGFKRVPVPAARRIKALMALLEEETGKKGLEALLAHAAELGA